ncbi:hypothetical protein [Streptomyces yaizuensis]|uniref:Integral membrane protein n=1 Tax=Streptomyces yaizuensis TaxID=2989713 RepID=A0ABQ5NXH9_9ACTN|nr:hypothetical protein [Streptomyces sp. YSPA8]GLF94929.1 hypothetical protein SYYSPA8_11550 [Streptomyces sp. YSPA8]
MDDENRPPGPASSATRSTPDGGRWEGTAAVVAGGGALVVWEPAFTLGAYDVVFYYQLLSLWAVSTGVLVSALLLRERLPSHGWVYAACLALPTVWLGIAALVPHRGGTSRELLFLAGGILSIIGTPLLTWLLLRILLFGEAELSARQQRRIVGAIAVVGLLAFTLGRLNDVFLTCGDFNISGNSVPHGCRPGNASPLG